MDEHAPSPERIFQLSSGYSATALLGAGAVHRIFTHIDGGADTLEAVARAAGLAPRGAQALLDGLVGLGLLTRSGGRYANTPEASRYLVEGKPGTLAGWAAMHYRMMAGMARLDHSVRTGEPAPGFAANRDAPESFWRELVPAIVPQSLPIARSVAEHLDVARRGPLEILDVGGGSGIYAQVLLGENPEATSTQVDLPAVNQVARERLAEAGVADRFRTLDGDYHQVDFGSSRFDLAIFSHIAHSESPESNRSLLRRIRAALRPGGTLVIADYILDEDRSGNAFALTFHATMLLGNPGGAVYREPDYRAWLAEAGFTRIELVPTPTPATLIFAR